MISVCKEIQLDVYEIRICIDLILRKRRKTYTKNDINKPALFLMFKGPWGINS